MEKKRKIDSECRKFKDQWNIQYFVIESSNKALCLICNESIAVLKEYNMKRHYETKHSQNYSKYTGIVRTEKFEALKRGLKSQQSLFTKVKTEQEAATRASFRVALEIAKRGKPFTDGEMIKECIIAVVEEMCPEKVNLLKTVSMSANTVARRVENIAENISSQLLDKNGHVEWFSLALDESTDVSDTAQVLIYIRGVDKSYEVHEELLDMYSIHGTTTGTDIFKGVEMPINKKNLRWKNLKCITTDGGKNMSGKDKGVVALVSKAVENDGGSKPLVLHCIIHQQSLCGKCLDMSDVLKPVISTVNFIRSFGLNHRQFRQFIAEIGETDLPYHTAVRWLSCGKVLQRFFELRAVIEIFLNEKHRPHTELQNNAWLWKLAFYVDLTKHVNELNLRLQGENQHLPDLYTNIKSFRMKLILFQSQLRSKCFSHFKTCEIFSHTTETEFPIDFAIETLSALKINFDTRFSDFDAIANQIKIFQNPFDADIETLAPELQMEMIDLQCSDIIKNKYENSSLLEFYKSLPLTQFDNLHKFARGLFSVFGTTYLCEKTFSKMKSHNVKIEIDLEFPQQGLKMDQDHPHSTSGGMQSPLSHLVTCKAPFLRNGPCRIKPPVLTYKYSPFTVTSLDKLQINFTEATSFYKSNMERLPRQQENNQRPSLLTELSSKLSHNVKIEIDLEFPQQGLKMDQDHPHSTSGGMQSPLSHLVTCKAPFLRNGPCRIKPPVLTYKYSPFTVTSLFLDTAAYPLPTQQDLFAVLAKGKYFSKLDLSSAYLQLEVATSTQPFLTINTHKGLFRVLAGIEGVICYIDDVLIATASVEKHLAVLKTVFLRLEKYNIKLKKDKCKFVQREIKYLGHLIKEDESGETSRLDNIYALSYMEDLPITAEEIRIETQKDEVLSIVKCYTQHGWPERVPDHLRPYFQRKLELTVDGECLLWGMRVIIPSSLRPNLLSCLHETHSGMSKMKSVARSHFWWPNLDNEIEFLVNRCRNCQQVQDGPNRVKWQPCIWAVRPWQRIHIDYANKDNINLLIVVDSHSKWVEAFPMREITSSKTIEQLRRLFSSYGLPEEIVSDNGPQFTVKEQQARQMKYDHGFQQDEFGIDDMVWCRNFRGGDRWIPGRIVGRKGSRVYTVLIHGQVKSYHRDQIRKRWENGGDEDRQYGRQREETDIIVPEADMPNRGRSESPPIETARQQRDSGLVDQNDGGISGESSRSLDPEASNEGPIPRRNPPRNRRPPSRYI
ncbi:EPM2AIP1 [Cordylochernes scorpioides]|uniref:EPM2AIP1 n=1 Tax=Cordylochernes scorpioides TaxID=51811 RepID=A0ABY6K7J3_9ARAC|nr:EPM2AIP1 [Cordylochernes scorpioides]